MIGSPFDPARLIADAEVMLGAPALEERGPVIKAWLSVWPLPISVSRQASYIAAFFRLEGAFDEGYRPRRGFADAAERLRALHNVRLGLAVIGAWGESGNALGTLLSSPCNPLLRMSVLIRPDEC